MQSATPSRPLSRSLVVFLLLGVLLTVSLGLLPAGFLPWLGNRLNVFAVVFLGIFIEAAPYLLLGTLASGLVEVFLDRAQMSKWISRRPVAAAVGGAFMGLAFPVCECGVVPLTR
ncbi:MAG: permease, partial [Chloroflexi bacterium]|nr:permease [Chloroflexota bacterium]